MSGFSAIIFDLDGTLIDSAPDIGRAANAALAERGLAAIDQAIIRRFVGQGGRALMRRALVHHGAPPDEHTLAETTVRFLDHYRRDPVGGTRLYPGAVTTLKALRQAGARLAVCTNKFEALSTDILRRLGILDLFEAVTGGDTFATRKPDPAHILGTLARLGMNEADARRAAMVGDSIHDIEAAAGANLASVAVAWGYADRPTAALGADAVIDHFDQLSGVLARLAQARGLS